MSQTHPANAAINTDIEVLRGVAVGLVVVTHLGGGLFRQPGPLLSLVDSLRFWGGVDLFFAISGFVIASSLLRQRTPTRFRDFAAPFYIRRIFRIWPAALLWLLLPLLASRYFNHSRAFGQTEVLLKDSAAAILQVADVYFGWCDCGKATVYWSLSLEEQFYLVFPVLLFFMSARNLRVLLILLVLTQLFLYRPGTSMLWYLRTDSISLGVLLAMLRRDDPAGRFSAAALLSAGPARVLALVLLPAIGWASVTSLTMANAGLLAVLSAACVWLASDNRDVVLPWPALRRPLLWTGSRSFAIYLAHYPCIWMAREILHRLHLPGFFGEHSEPMLLVVFLVLTIAASELTYRIVEQPFRDIGRRMAAKYHGRVDSAPCLTISSAGSAAPRCPT